MKSLLFVIIVAASALSSCAQNLNEADVPSVVKSAFSSLYPNSGKAKWEKENNLYEAEFDVNKTETSILFDGNGRLVQTETEMAVSSLPQGVSDYVSKNMAGKKIEEAVKIVDAGGKVSYEAEVGNEDYIFDANGNFLNKEQEDAGEEDDD